MKVVLVAWVRVFRFWIPDTWGTGLAKSRKVEAPNRSLTSIQHLVEGARDDPQLRIGRLANCFFWYTIYSCVYYTNSGANC